MLRKGIYLLGVFLRNRKIFANHSFLMKSKRWTIDELESHQLTHLKVLLLRAYEKSAFYREKFDRHGIHPSSIRTLQDLARVPPLSKDELLANVDGIQLDGDGEKLFFSETSGSSGTPLVFYRNADWDAWHRAAVLRGYDWYCVRPWERNGYLWGYNISLKRRLKVRLLDALQNRFRLFSYKDDEINRFAGRLKSATYLEGYSSMIYEVAKRINRGVGVRPSNLKMVKGTSEKIFPQYQDEVQKALGRRMISEYGAAEAGIIAFECPSGSMHMTMETVIVEVENNEVIVTNLVSKSFPIIRYKLGDYVEVDTNAQCACGMAHHVIREVTGRVGRVIRGVENDYPSLTLYYVFKNLAIEHNLILNYRATQRKQGHLTMDIENRLTPDEKALLLKECDKYYGRDLEVDVYDEVDLRSSKKKKLDFVSDL
ncbi:MAG: phenylacetate--CoA ligase family protein [Sterolibacteriaceae bacterium]|nr:phenylacetate--CoA ligase family protein [Candidatus Methylophosphatis haderslevensis]